MNATRFALVLLPVVATSLIQSHSPIEIPVTNSETVGFQDHSLRQNALQTYMRTAAGADSRLVLTPRPLPAAPCKNDYFA